MASFTDLVSRQRMSNERNRQNEEIQIAGFSSFLSILFIWHSMFRDSVCKWRHFHRSQEQIRPNRFGNVSWPRIFFQWFFEISRYCFWNVDYPNRKCFHHFKQWKHFRSLRKSTPISQFYDQFRLNHFKWYFNWILLNVIFLVFKTGGLFLRFPRNAF